MQRSCLFICSVLSTHPISCAICVSVVICINFYRKKKKEKKKRTLKCYIVRTGLNAIRNNDINNGSVVRLV